MTLLWRFVAAIPEPAREPVAQFATLLAATVGLLVLIGCFTVGILLLVRTEGRRGELAMCLALGARAAILPGESFSKVSC